MNSVKSGHPRFYELTRAEEDLHERKNRDYAGGGKPTGNFDRNAAIMSLYPGFPINTNYGIALVQMLKQFDAAMWLLCTGRKGEIEDVPERLGDVSVYAKLARLMYEEEQLSVREPGNSSRDSGAAREYQKSIPVNRVG